MISALELGKLAGLFEGEGCFTLANRYGRHPCPRIQFSSTDEDVTRWVARRIGQAILYRQPPKAYGAIVGTKPQFAVVAQGARAVAWMMTLYPLLHLRRRAKIREIVEVWKQYPLNHGNLELIRRRLEGLPSKIAAGCHPSKPHEALGLCGACYMRQYRTGTG